jgi:hypothetical protein
VLHTIGTFATRAQAGEAVTTAHFARALGEAMASSDGESRAVAAFRTACADIRRARRRTSKSGEGNGGAKLTAAEVARLRLVGKGNRTAPWSSATGRGTRYALGCGCAARLLLRRRPFSEISGGSQEPLCM